MPRTLFTATSTKAATTARAAVPTTAPIGLASLFLCLLLFAACKHEAPAEYPAMLCIIPSFSYQDSTGTHLLFPDKDGSGALSGYHVDSVAFLSMSQTISFAISRTYSQTHGQWVFSSCDYDGVRETGLGGRDTVECRQEMIIRFNAAESDTMGIWYKFKRNPYYDPHVNEEAYMRYRIDYVRIEYNHLPIYYDTLMEARLFITLP